MSRRMTVAAIVLACACVVSLAAIVLRPAPPKPPRPPAPTGARGPGIAAESTRFVGRSGGERRWEFDADEVLVKQGESRVSLRGIRDGVLYDAGKAWMHFSAERAEVDTATNDITLEDVVIQSEQGDTLTADTLAWFEDEDKVVVEGNVRVARDSDSVLLCDRAEYRPGDNVLESTGRTTVEIELSDE